MELRLVAKEERYMEIEFMDEDETLLYPITQKLLEDPNVESAAYVLGHPELDFPSLRIKVKKGTPTQALKKAIKALDKDFSDFQKVLQQKAV